MNEEAVRDMLCNASEKLADIAASGRFYTEDLTNVSVFIDMDADSVPELRTEFRYVLRKSGLEDF